MFKWGACIWQTKNDVITALKICSSSDENGCLDCEECPYKNYSWGGTLYKGTNCDEELMKDVLEYLN